MCLSHKISDVELRSKLPGEDLICFKFVKRLEGSLTSPHYYYKWGAGTHISEDKAQGTNGDVGFYLMLLDPGQVVAFANGEVVIRLHVKASDIVAGGVDQYRNAKGLCVVVSKCEVTEEDFQEALSGHKQNLIVDEAVREALERIDKMVPEFKEEEVRDEKKLDYLEKEIKPEQAAVQQPPQPSELPVSKEAEFTARKVAKKSKKGGGKETAKKITKKGKGVPEEVDKIARQAVKKAKKNEKSKEKDESKKNLESENVDVLRSVAKILGISGASRMIKTELVKAIKKIQGIRLPKKHK